MGKAAAAVKAAGDKAEVATLLGEKVKLTMKGKDVMVDSSKVTATDVMTPNGVVHLIDSVLVPPSLLDAVAAFKPAKVDAAKPNIVATAQATPDLSALVTALTLPGQADVLAALQGAGPFTVFAPTNGGFEALKTLKNADGISLYDFVTRPANAAVLTKILQYHVLASEVKAAAAVKAAGDKAEVATLLGEKVKLTMKGKDVMVDSSKVTATDVMTSNGVVHLIDNVLVPPTLRDTVATFTAAAARTNPPTTQTAASSASTLAVFSGAVLSVVAAALCV